LPRRYGNVVMSSTIKLPDEVRRVVLVGLMGAGKTTIGQLLAKRLGWSFVDLDTAIEARTARTVSQIFTEEGEDAFRRLEQQLTAELASREQIVFTPGGGWITQAGAVEGLAEHTAVFWLQVSPEEAVRRVQQDTIVRPLLQQGDPLEVARRLAERRNALYERIGVPIQTEQRAPDQVTREIMNTLGDRIVDSSAIHEGNG
jgi:shikimate kinase